MFIGSNNTIECAKYNIVITATSGDSCKCFLFRMHSNFLTIFIVHSYSVVLSVNILQSFMAMLKQTLGVTINSSGSKTKLKVQPCHRIVFYQEKVSRVTKVKAYNSVIRQALLYESEETRQ